VFGILVGTSSPDIGSRFEEMTGAAEIWLGRRLTRRITARRARVVMFRL